jgi:hypothetical protein
MVSKPVCRFFQSPGGCRQGSNCRYAHSTSQTSGATTGGDNAGESKLASIQLRLSLFNWLLELLAQSSSNANVPAGVCRYFWTRGSCNRGTSCTFTHQNQNSQTDVPAGAPICYSFFPLSERLSFSAPPVQVPYGVCRAFWTTGLCGRGESCKFQHRANPDVPPPQIEQAKTLQSHFKAAGLGSFPALETDKFSAGIGTNASFGETNGLLRRFLKDDFRFQTAAQIYSFLEIICNANTQNAQWVCHTCRNSSRCG